MRLSIPSPYRTDDQVKSLCTTLIPTHPSCECWGGTSTSRGVGRGRARASAENRLQIRGPGRRQVAPWPASAHPAWSSMRSPRCSITAGPCCVSPVLMRLVRLPLALPAYTCSAYGAASCRRTRVCGERTGHRIWVEAYIHIPFYLVRVTVDVKKEYMYS